MTGEQKKEIRFILDREIGALNSHRDDRDHAVDRIIVELEKIWPKPMGRPLSPGEHTVISADPLGSDRAARTLPQNKIITVDPVDGIFGRKSA
jgi:hypothetical protein